MRGTRGAFTVRLRVGIGAVAIAGLLAGACSSQAEPPQQSATASEARLDDAEAALARAEAAAAAARFEVEAARSEAEAARAEAQAAQVDLEQAEEAAGGMRLANATAQSRVEEAEEALTAAQAEVESARVEADEARAAADAMRAEAAAAQSDVERAEEAAAAARAEIEAAQAAVESARMEADEARTRAEEANAQAGAAEDAAAVARAVAASANVEAQEAEAAAAAARAEAEAARSELEQAAAAAAAAEAARATQEQAAASSTTTTAATTPTTTTAATSPPGPPEDTATEDMSGDYDMGADDMMDDGGSGGTPSAAAPIDASTRGSPPLRPASGCPDCSGNTFEDYGVNPFVSTDEDPLSTFALDVDTASFVVARNFLLGDELPPPEAVRVEEFVNYFDGGYEPVPDEFDVDLEAAPSPFAADGHVLLRVGVRAPDILHGVALPGSIVVVMDRSGSMGRDAGYRGQRLERIDLAHRAVELLLEGLADGTRVGIVSYDDQVETVVEPTDVAGSRDGIMTRVRYEVTPRGSTNAAAGLASGYEMALGEAEAGRSVLVLLLSDGVANVGATRTTEILEQIGERGDIGLSTIGVGLGPFNDALMEQLANSADGTYHYIDSFREARRILADNLPSLLSVAARDAKIQVEFDPDVVRSYRLLGFENRDVADEDFRDNTVDAGEVGLGQSSTALYELELVPPAERQGGATTLATATLRYEHPHRGSITEVDAAIGTGDVATAFDAAGARFRLAAVVAEFAEVLRASPFVDEGHTDMSLLATQAVAVAEALADDPDAADLVTLIETARRVSGGSSGSG